MSTADGLALLGAIRDALATDEGARLAREIRALVARANETEAEGSGYAARVVARAYARVEGQLPTRRRTRRNGEL